MASDFDNVKQQRKAARSSFTKAAKKLEDTISTENPEDEDVEIFLDQLTEKYKTLKSCEDKYLELYQKKSCTEEEYEKEYDSAQEYYDKFSILRIKSDRLKFKRQINIVDQNVSSSSAAVVTTTKQKLPEIELFKFDGDPRHWLTFWTQFSKINEDIRIDTRDKFQYLLQSTKPDSVARHIVESFPATEGNYKKALDYLKERFGKESVLIQIYTRELLKLVISDKTRLSLLELYDKLQTQLRALETLGLTQDKYSHMLFPLVESSLPSDLIKIWERQKNAAPETGKSDLDLLMEFVKNEVETEFRIKVTRDVLGSEKLNVKRNKYDFKCVTPTACELLNMNSKSNNNFSESSNKFKKLECIFCSKFHLSENCNDAFSMSLDSKKDIIKKKNACFVCLKRFHRQNSCQSKHRCPICKHRHFVILCPDLTSHKVENVSNGEKSETKTSTLNNYVKLSDIYLQTLIVKIHHGSKQMFIRAVIDTGSMKSYICTDIAQKMNYNSIGEVKIKQSLFGGVETPESVYKNYLIEISDVYDEYRCKFEVLSQSNICSDIKQVPSGPLLEELKLHDIKISDLKNNQFKVNEQIKLLIGADIAGKLLSGKIVNLKSGITAIKTKLGWCLLGKLNPGVESNGENSASTLISALLVKEKCVSNLWRLDLLGITEPPLGKTKTQLQDDTHKYFEETLSVNREGRYEIALPWVLDSALLPDNKINAERGIINAKRKLMNSGKFNDYCNVFKDWLSLGITERVPDDKQTGIHFLTHRPIFKDNSTTNIRPVFNASFHLPGFPSLNDCLSTGPNLIEMIPSILNRFRINYVGITSDIEKAFLQIAIREKDRDFLRFLWFSGENLEQVEVYRHKRVVFGITCSPYLLAATLQYHLDRVPENLKQTANILKKAFYVDNCVTSLNSEIEMKKFFLESKIIMATGHFNLRCWKSNISSEIFEGENSSAEENVSLLGHVWHTNTDTLSCKVEKVTNFPEPITKRVVLAVAHQVFDIIGYTAPVMLLPKLILQDTWNSKLKWDDTLPDDLIKKFRNWYQKLYLLSSINVPRWFGITISDESISLHLFCDSSKKAYGACVFIRVENEGGVRISLVNARSRVAPLKPITIPRLELLACCIGSRLLSSIIKDLNLSEVDIYCWTDSTTALCWIQRDQNWGTFIHNRVQEIRSLTSPATWHHISGTLNPSDLLSRGCSAEQLVEHKWWEGPAWLRLREENWPKSEGKPNEDLVSSEIRKTVIATLVKTDDNANWYYRYFSSYKKIVRMLSWIFRFYDNITKSDKKFSKDLSVSEIERGERALMLLIQKESFKGENDEKLRQLRPIVDCNGLIRARSNVVYRDDKYDFKFPIILPSDHSVVKLLIMSVHNDLLHAGTTLVMSNLREIFWILKSRKTVRNCIHKCVKCQRFKAKKCEAIPGILPSDRVRDARIFQIIGCDLAGPLYLKDGRKSYIVLFTCAVYRAVHLELITSLSTECFFQALRRFIARRGRPSTVYSDRGKNFVGAENFLRSVDWDSLRFKAAEQKIQWKLNPPAAPWWGGWWERLIQIVKQLLRKVLGRASLDYEELLTVLCDCERVINSRPLTYVSEDIDDDIPITPENFLLEKPQSGVPDIDNVDKVKLSKRMKYIQRIRENLRVRFRTEYLGQLRQQSVKCYKSEPLRVGEIVLLEDANKKRSYWNLARVLKVIPGRDGEIRLALIKTNNTELLRPVQRLFRLELENPVSELDNEPLPLTTSSGRVIKKPVT